MLQKYVLTYFLIIFFFSCKNEPSKLLLEEIQGDNIGLKYAEGFSVKDYGSYVIIKIFNPWQNSNSTYKYAILKENADNDFWSTEKVRFDKVFNFPINKIVATSTTHIPALELLGVENTLVGFPGTDYISSKTIRSQIDNGKVRELGKNDGLNTEVLLELKPDVVVGFGVDGNNKSLNTIEKSGIPVIYNGDWVEKSPLAKAEWIKFFGVLYNKQKEADSIFNIIETNYKQAQKLAKQVQTQPTVISGALHKDVWYLPNGTSTEAQFLKDANVNYLYADTKGEGSLALSFESVFEKAKTADLWLSPSYYTSIEALKEANQHYTQFDAFKNNNIYTFSNTTGQTGGVLYYELGLARPDLVLKDIIKICHPELLKDYQPTFFKPLK